jgi:hypothetical protein
MIAITAIMQSRNHGFRRLEKFQILRFELIGPFLTCVPNSCKQLNQFDIYA